MTNPCRAEYLGFATRCRFDGAGAVHQDDIIDPTGTRIGNMTSSLDRLSHRPYKTVQFGYHQPFNGRTALEALTLAVDDYLDNPRGSQKEAAR